MSPGILEIVETPLYDTVALPILGSQDADPPPAELFTVPLYKMARVWPGNQSRPKSYQETNLLESGMLHSTQQFVVRSIRAAFRDLDGALMPVSSRYYPAAHFRFTIAQKPYYEAPLWKVADPATMFLAPDALKLFQPHERTELVRSLRQGFSAADSPLIDHAQPFHCSVDFDPAVDWRSVGAPAALIVCLEGQFARPVQ